MKKLFLISSTAGASEYRFSKDDIMAAYEKAGRLDQIIVAETSYQGHIEEIVRAFDTKYDGEKVVIILGGDGSLNEVVNAAYGTGIAVGLIPTGTGNDFAKNFSYKNFDLSDTFNIKLRHIDLIKINDRFCVNATSLGFDTEILNKAYEYLDKNPRLGKKAYLMAVADRIKKLTYENLDISLELADGSLINIKDEFLISAICNGAFYGSGFNPAPDAKINDGLINLITCRKFPRPLLFPLILKYKKGKHQNSSYVNEHIVKSGIIKSNKEFVANIDGEVFWADEIKFEIIPNAINWAYFEK